MLAEIPSEYMNAVYHAYRGLLDELRKRMNEVCSEAVALSIDSWPPAGGTSFQEVSQVAQRRLQFHVLMACLYELCNWVLFDTCLRSRAPSIGYCA